MSQLQGVRLSDPVAVPDHSHEKSGGEGGDLGDYLRLTRAGAQVIEGGPVSVPGVVVTGAGGLDMTAGGAVTLASLETTPIQTTIDGNICTDGAASMTDAREWLRPDTGGTYVMSKPLVALVNQDATATGNVLVGPDPGHYAFLIYVDNKSALAAGTVLAAIDHTSDGGARSQPALAALTLTMEGAQSTIVVCKVASGDVTYAFTVAGAVGTPSYDASVIPLGRLA